MPISDKHKIIFIHIPKTAGSSIEYALGMHGKNNKIGIERYINQVSNNTNLFGNDLQHLSSKEIKKHIDIDKYLKYYKFSIVRNPYDRLVSHFAWLNGKWLKNEKLNKDEFRKNILKINKLRYKNDKHLMPQHLYVYNKTKLCVNSIIKYENIHLEILKLSDLLGIEIKLEKRMVSNHDHYLSYYDNDTILKVNSLYKKDFKLFEYDTI